MPPRNPTLVPPDLHRELERLFNEPAPELLYNARGEPVGYPRQRDMTPEFLREIEARFTGTYEQLYSTMQQPLSGPQSVAAPPGETSRAGYPATRPRGNQAAPMPDPHAFGDLPTATGVRLNDIGQSLGMQRMGTLDPSTIESDDAYRVRLTSIILLPEQPAITWDGPSAHLQGTWPIGGTMQVITEYHSGSNPPTTTLQSNLVAQYGPGRKTSWARVLDDFLPEDP